MSAKQRRRAMTTMAKLKLRDTRAQKSLMRAIQNLEDAKTWLARRWDLARAARLNLERFKDSQNNKAEPRP